MFAATGIFFVIFVVLLISYFMAGEEYNLIATIRSSEDYYTFSKDMSGNVFYKSKNFTPQGNCEYYLEGNEYKFKDRQHIENNRYLEFYFLHVMLIYLSSILALSSIGIFIAKSYGLLSWGNSIPFFLFTGFVLINLFSEGVRNGIVFLNEERFIRKLENIQEIKNWKPKLSPKQMSDLFVIYRNKITKNEGKICKVFIIIGSLLSILELFR